VDPPTGDHDPLADVRPVADPCTAPPPVGRCSLRSRRLFVDVGVGAVGGLTGCQLCFRDGRSVSIGTGGPWPSICGLGWPARARASTRRRASGRRYVPAIPATRAAAWSVGMPADVTYNGRTALPRRTAIACGGAERGLGHADDMGVQMGVQVCPEAGASVRVQVHVAVDDDQCDRPAEGGEYRLQRGQFAGEELSRLVGRHVREPADAFLGDLGEPRVAGRDQRGSGATRRRVVHVDRRVQSLARCRHTVQSARARRATDIRDPPVGPGWPDADHSSRISGTCRHNSHERAVGGKIVRSAAQRGKGPGSQGVRPLLSCADVR
jgi:hypothetical protein